jgi:cobyrinic acid a,c-diamide synthase
MSASHKYVKMAGIIQKNLLMNANSSRTRNSRNHNNQDTTTAPTEQLSAEEFHYETLTA